MQQHRRGKLDELQKKCYGMEGRRRNRPQVLPGMGNHNTENFAYSNKGISIQYILEITSPFSSQISEGFAEKTLILIKRIFKLLK